MNEANNQPNFIVPLFASTQEVSKLFSVGRTTLYRLRRDHTDFRELTIKSGREVLYDVPRCYQWFKQRCGGELE